MTATLRVGDAPGRPLSGGRGNSGGGQRRHNAADAASAALWLFIMVASTLFALFLAAYIMRMSQSDWFSITLPRQLWLSTSLLLIGSGLLQGSRSAAHKTHWQQARALFAAGGACALAFLASQWWGWQALQAAHVMAAGNPAASFFYLLTAMHGLHVIGGLAAWGWTARRAKQDQAGFAWRLALCARYWHFLLAVWLALFAALAWLTPEIARVICGVR
jgi:cytochrome c oxidase subunit 3